jgi:sugar lactone lactonase YvrE
VDGTLLPVAEEVAPDGTRMNDAACDPEGRFWAGTLAHDHHAGGGALYRLDRDGQTELVLEGLTISNGLRATEDWSEEQHRAEPTAGLTYRFDTDATGQPAAPFRPDPTWWATVIS